MARHMKAAILIHKEDEDASANAVQQATVKVINKEEKR